MTIYGWDMSHYDAIPAGGGAAVAREGFSFVTHKAGGDANDAELGAWWSAFRNSRDRLLLGAYWVLYPGNPTGRADAFLARLDNLCAGWRDGPFILQVDCEIWGGDRSTLPGRADVQKFCDRLHAKAPKLMPIVYGPKWCYGETLNGLTYPLWASSYVNGIGPASALYPGDGSAKWNQYSGQTPMILQFSSSATIVGQTTCDANAYRGTLDQLTAALAPGWQKEEDVPLTDEDVSKVVRAFYSFDPGLNSDGTPWPGISDATYPPGGNGTVALGTALSSLLARQKGYGDSDRAAAAQLLSAVQSASGVPADVLAAALAPLLLPPILAAVNALPAGEHLTKADVGEALANVLRLGVGQGGS